MAKFTTRKATATGKAQTLARRRVRAVKRGAVSLNRSGRVRTAQAL